MRRKRSHKIYKLKIGHLAYKTSRGDLLAESRLETELLNPAAQHILIHIMNSNTLGNYAPKKKFAMSRPSSGNAFKIYSGGAPGLGRRS